jgi:type II secretory pathway pseudopilin PulG
VVALVSLITALAAPKVTKVSRRMIVESSLTDIRRAISETAMRACATGQSLTLTLEQEASTFRVRRTQTLPANNWLPSQAQSAESKAGTIIAGADSYALNKNIEWQLGDSGFGSTDNVEYAFFPDGQASGPPLRFTIRNRQFQLDVDRLTGNPLIQELE